MVKTTHTLAEAARDLSRIVHRVWSGEGTVVLVEDSRPVAEIVPVKRAKTGAELAARAWTRAPRLSPEEAESFARDVEEGRDVLNRPPVAGPWP